MIINEHITLENIDNAAENRGAWKAPPAAAVFGAMAIPSIVYTLKPNAAGDQLTNDPDGLSVPGITIPTPTGFKIDSTTSSSLTFSWNSVTDPNIDGFEVEINEDGSGWVQANPTFYDDLDRSGGSYGLAADTYYGHRCRAGKVNPDSSLTTSAWSNEAWQTTDETIILPPPTGGTTNLAALPVFENFERFSNGTKFTDATSSGDWGACDNLTVDTSRPFPGLTRSGKTWLRSGQGQESNGRSTGYGYWGYDCRHAPEVAHGGEIWWRQAFYFPANASVNAGGNPQLKTFRLMRHRSGQNYSKSTGVGITHPEHYPITIVEGSSGSIKPPGSDTTWHEFPTSIPFGRWTMVEVYCSLHTSSSVGAQACWIDGQLVGLIKRQTAESTSDYVGSLYLGTYWNGGVEAAGGYQEHWYSQIAVASRGPTTGGSRDDTPNMDYDPVSGLPFIGMATA